MLSVLDGVIIIAYFVATLLLGLWATRRAAKQSSRGFFVAEKSLPWPMIGLTMVAASISAEQMLGEVGYSSSAGLVVSNWDLSVFPALVLMVFIFLPLYLRSGITTIPEYLEKRYNRTTRLLFAVYTVFNNACVALVMVLALGATALKYFVGLDIRWGVLLLIVMTGVYTVYGGMLAVAWTQTLQCALLLAGGLLLFAVGISHVPDGWSGLFERMYTDGRGHLIRPFDDPYVPWPGLILLMLSTNVWYCCTNQFYVQSCLGAKSERHGRMGVLFTAFLWPVLTLCFAFPGYIAHDLLSANLIEPLPLGPDGQPNADATYPHLVGQLLGSGLRGFMVAAVIGAIMSSVAAIVNATGSVFTHDLYHRLIEPDADEKRLVRVARLTGIITLLIAFPLTLLATRYQYIFTYSQNAWCILAIPIMLVFTYGALWKRASATAAVATFVFVAPFVAVPYLFGNQQDNFLTLPHINERIHVFNFAFGLWLAAAVFMFIVSLLTRRPDPKIIGPLVWGRHLLRITDDPRQPKNGARRLAAWCILAGIVYLVIYIKYR